MIRFLLMWAVCAALIYIFIYVLKKNERMELRVVLFRVVVSAVISGLMISGIFLINNLQGI